MESYLLYTKYHRDPWPYPKTAGVGLALSGRPTDPCVFIDILRGASCPLVATRRVLADLEAGNTRFTTVTAAVHFDWVGDELAKIGVTMQIVPPRANPDITRYDDAALGLLKGEPDGLEGFSDEEKALIQSSHRDTLASIARLPHDAQAYL
jgi:hypothetical protein